MVIEDTASNCIFPNGSYGYF